MTRITAGDFDREVMDCELPVFACFVTRWCHSCYPTCLVTGELAGNYDGRVKFVKLDIEESPEIAQRYNIIAVPTILLFQDSQPVKKLVGFQELKSLRALLNGVTAGNETVVAPIPEELTSPKIDKGVIMTREQMGHESLIRQGIAKEETIQERIDEDGNRWTKVYFGGGAHLRNWLSQFVELKGKENVQLEEIDPRGFQCFEESGEKMCRIWVKEQDGMEE